MYPLDKTACYPRSQWYIAGYGAELSEALLGRRILGKPIVFYRAENGDPVALSGLCVHRFMPLKDGRLENGFVVCPYHGYTYGKNGRCHTIPTGAKPSPHARLISYPLVERGPLIWIWMGDPDAPDLSILPDASDIGLGADSQGWRVDLGKTLSMKARPALLVDNLFDLSHLAFIHSASIPDGAALCMIPPVISTIGGRLRVSRSFTGIEIQEHSILDSLIPVARQRGNLHFLLHSEMYNPGLINASGPWLWTAGDHGPGDPVAMLNFIHGITPETENSAHYFGIVTRDYLIEDDRLSALLVDQIDRVRAEDVVALEAVELEADSHASTQIEISTKVDEGALRARRILRKMIDADALSDR